MFRFKKSLTFFAIFCLIGGFLGFVSASTTKAVSISAGDLIKASTAAVYYHGSDGGRYCFPNAKTYFTWYDDFSTVKTISDAELAAIPLKGNVAYKPGVRMVKITTDPKVYAVDAGGALRWVTSEAAAISLYGSDWNTKIDDIPDPFFVNYTMGADISSAADFDRSVIESAATSIDVDKGLTEAPAEGEETPGLPTAPVLTAPTSATPGISFPLSWTASASAFTYTLQKSTSLSFTSPATVYSGFSTSATDSINATSYYRVRAQNAIGSGAWSSIKTVDTGCPILLAPTLSVSDSSVTSGTGFTVSWAAISGATSYNLERGTNSSFTGAVSITLAALTSTSALQSFTVSSDTAYYYRVRASNDCGPSAWSNAGSVQVTAGAADVCTVADACASRSTGSVYRCNSSGSFSSSGDHYCECQADDSARISCPGDTTVGGICVVDNACFGSSPGSTYRCSSSGAFSSSGDHYCECQTDCTVYVSQESDVTLNNTCVVNNACFGSSPGSGHRCDETGYFNINGAYWCTCESDCTVACNVANVCASRSTGSVYRCSSSGAFSSSGDHYCECQADDSARISCAGDVTIGGTCVLSNGCFGRSPGSGYRCNSSGYFDSSGLYWCTCSSDCTVAF